MKHWLTWGVSACLLVGAGACSDEQNPLAADAAVDATAALDGANANALDCEVAIVGGGAGGVHTAFRLGPSMGARVCLFEKEAVLGGRIKDVAMDEGNPSSPVFGVGARRVMQGQTVLFGLATELGVSLQLAPGTGDLINARGGFATSKNDLVSRYPGLEPVSGDHEDALYVQLMTGSGRASVASYPDFRSYVRTTLGSEEYAFLHDMSRFRADFEYPLDARGYMDYFDEEYGVCCDASYPVGGMSAFIRGMAAEAMSDGVRIFTSEPVSQISRDGSGYRLITSTHTVTAAKVVIAVPPVAFPYLTGDIVDEIEAKPQFKDLIGVKVATVTQWWPTAWWENIQTSAKGGRGVWRGWTTEHCINFIEIPVDPYGVAQRVTRSVYDDDAACVAFWEETAARGIPAVEAEIKRGLTHLFSGNGVTSPATVTIPDPTKTYVQIWPAAWYWLKAGSAYTNANIFDWALEPLAGEDVALVGEAYNPQRSGWSDAAYKSSLHLLNSKYGLNLPGLARVRPDAGPASTPASMQRRFHGRRVGGH